MGEERADKQRSRRSWERTQGRTRLLTNPRARLRECGAWIGTYWVSLGREASLWGHLLSAPEPSLLALPGGSPGCEEERRPHTQAAPVLEGQLRLPHLSPPPLSPVQPD